MKSLKYNKLFTQLAPSEQEKIKALYSKDVEDENNKYFAKLQKNWLMLSCIVMADFMGKDKDECLLYLANFKEVYRLNSKIKGEEAQQEWLKGEMDRIFGKDNYPYQYIDKLEDIGT